MTTQMIEAMEQEHGAARAASEAAMVAAMEAVAQECAALIRAGYERAAEHAREAGFLLEAARRAAATAAPEVSRDMMALAGESVAAYRAALCPQAVRVAA